MRTRWRAADLFSGCGGLTVGLKHAGFDVVSAVEIDPLAISTYTANHPEVRVIPRDITTVNATELCVGKDGIDLVAGCPPCQGFSRVHRRNRPEAAKDPRNDLMGEYQRLVEELNPAAVAASTPARGDSSIPSRTEPSRCSTLLIEPFSYADIERAACRTGNVIPIERHVDDAIRGSREMEEIGVE